MSSNEFASCVIDSIKQLMAQVRNIVLRSDGYTYQNFNRVLARALQDVTSSHNKVIEQLYFEQGHTMMEADLVHAQLEKI